ncbi:alpha/beta fold hydrolase [Alkalimarinus alittae]|uniref:Alpha/beta fold hydrolase n=1 Tax=Alkalimarinus alittae TaxID=2961619 RepID=A0ABY6MZP5_9ALTE|nr:alpha/beta fold hydrolase [Alkalimarinus alittae]UZE95265.1 alpha/beta fold hydrolase [Alkalimarinus alittae]
MLDLIDLRGYVKSIGSVKNIAIDIAEKALWSVVNTAERKLFGDNFIISNLTPYDVIYRDRIMSVRHYLPLEDASITIGDDELDVASVRHRVPLVLVPPLAATSMIFDLMPHRSVVRYFLAKGFDVYLIDWGHVTEADSDLSLETYVLEWMPAIMQQVRKVSGEQDVSIFAYCMGGLLSLMYAAVSGDKNIKNMITVASPIDMHSSGVAGRVLSTIYRPAQMVSQLMNISLLDLPAKYLHVPGWVNSLAFKLTSPVGNVVNYVEMLMNMWDREYLKEHLTMSQWFDDMVDYPGETIKDMAVHMMINNRMAKGTMTIGKQKAEFKKINCSILAFAGDNDTLVSIRAARMALDIVSSEDKEFCVVPGGHAGVFAGGKAPANAWAISADWLAERSN